MLDGSTITNHAIKIIERNLNKKPFFLLIHYIDTHLPYNSPKKYEKEFFEETSNNERIEDVLKRIKNPRWREFLKKCLSDAKTTDDVVAKYDGAIFYVDENIGRLIDYLNKHEILDDTIVIITSDHGESLTEHNIYFSHHGLYDVTIHVPLIIKYTELPKKRLNCFVQHVDIVPTLLDILNIKIDSFFFDGVSLLPLVNGKIKQIREAIFAEESAAQRKRAIRTEDLKYITKINDIKPKSGFEYEGIFNLEEDTCRYCGFKHAEPEELYDLKNDPNEVSNIAYMQTDIVQELRSKMDNWVRNLIKINEMRMIKMKIRRIQDIKRI